MPRMVIFLTRFSLITCLLMLTSFTSHAVAHSRNWQRFTSTAGRVSVLFPGAVKHRLDIVDSPLGHIKEHRFSWVGRNLELDASYSDLPRLALIFGGYKKIFSEAQKALMEATHGELKAYHLNKWGRYRAADMEFEVLPNGKNKRAQIGQARFFLVKRRLYVLVALTNQPKPDLMSLEKFFGSFRLEEKEK